MRSEPRGSARFVWNAVVTLFVEPGRTPDTSTHLGRSMSGVQSASHTGGSFVNPLWITRSDERCDLCDENDDLMVPGRAVRERIDSLIGLHLTVAVDRSGRDR